MSVLILIFLSMFVWQFKWFFADSLDKHYMGLKWIASEQLLMQNKIVRNSSTQMIKEKVLQIEQARIMWLVFNLS